jgi:Zn-dependent protease
MPLVMLALQSPPPGFVSTSIVVFAPFRHLDLSRSASDPSNRRLRGIRVQVTALTGSVFGYIAAEPAPDTNH